MRIIDVDAHLHEPLDWVERTDPGLAEALGPPARFMEIAGDMFGFSDPSFARCRRRSGRRIASTSCRQASSTISS